jgi:hypothetical protein
MSSRKETFLHVHPDALMYFSVTLKLLVSIDIDSLTVMTFSKSEGNVNELQLKTGS